MQAGEANPDMNLAERKGRSASRVWVLVVIAVGLVSGVVLSLLMQFREIWFGYNRFLFERIEPLLTFHVILSTIGMALLVSLLVVYVHVYAETKANFALGLIIVLAALLLRSLLSSPLLLFVVGTIPLGPRAFLSVADVFAVVAYAVFLYLSLE